MTPEATYQAEAAKLIADELEEFGASGASWLTLLDALACAELELRPMGEINFASEAFILSCAGQP